MRHAAKLFLLSVGSLVVLLVASGATFEGVSRVRAAHRFPATGRMIDIGDRRMQLDCRGSGSPTVVLESGLDHMGSLSWAAVHDSIAATTRVCAYSRAGIMWSDRSPEEFSARSVATDLRATLTGAGEGGPFVMVGHSIGGPYITVFTSMYPTEVAGLVFVDASHPDQFDAYEKATGKVMKPTTDAVALGVALAWTGLVRLLPGAAPENTPAAAAEAANAFLPTSLGALLNETGALDATMIASGAVRNLGDRPLVVLTAMKAQSPEMLKMNGMTAEQGGRLLQASKILHDDQATWSSRGSHQVVPDATHFIQLDRPDVVIDAVRRVVGQVRNGSAY